MEVGDLVIFDSGFWTAAVGNYENPGLIIEVDSEHRQRRYTVIWAGGKITTEHAGLLKPVSQVDDEII